MHEELWFTKSYYGQNDSYENLDNFSVILNGFCICKDSALMADQLLPQLLMEQFDTLYKQCRHIEHMHEELWFTKSYYWQNDSYENLDNFSKLYYNGVMLVLS